MTLRMDSGPLKLAEKLVILNDRSVGMLTRLYNIKKACSDPKSRPQFLNDKSLDAAVAHITKKFPVTDIKRNSSSFASIESMKHDIIKNLSLYYYTFADLLDLKDHILQLLTVMDANQCQLDITLNYDLTAGFLNLVVNFICIMVLLSRVEDRKAVLGLFNAAYDLVHATSEPSFPRLGQMIVDYEHPLRRLSEDLGTLNRLVYSALNSLRAVYFRRNISAEQQREASMFSLISNPKELLFAAQTETVACEYLSLDVMDRWIIFGVTVCHNALLNDQAIWSLYQRALQHGLAIRLYRDEFVLVFPLLQSFFETMKGYGKKVQEIKDLAVHTLHTCGSLHAHRRQFLRTALRELCFLTKDQPGLLGPKILFVWMALSYARDEIVWLLRHADIWHLVNVGKKTKGLDSVIIDKCLPELLFYMVELRNLVIKFDGVVSRYYAEYVNGYDAVALAEVAAGLGNLSEDDAVLVRSFVESSAHIKSDNVDLRGMRLDWFRFQANTSVLRSHFQLKAHRNFVVMMNTTVFHLKMVDMVHEMVRETSDLSIYCFYPTLFDSHLKQCLSLPMQSRYTIAFADIASQFTHSLHDMCPEERDHITERGLISCNAVLEELSRRAIDVITQIGNDEMGLTQSLSPQACAQVIAVAYQQPQSGKNQQTPPADVKMPGHESLRTPSEPVSVSERSRMYLVELCQAIGYTKELAFSGYTFAPREFFAIHLERHLMSVLIRFLKPEGSENPRRPTEMFAFLTSQMSVLQNIDTCLNIDLTRIFNDALLQQTQGLDSQGKETMTSIYAKWYLEVLLRRASTSQVVYTDHLQSFVGNAEAPPLSFSPERYTDARELRCLAQLIGPYGVKFLSERLIWHVSLQLMELYKTVYENREALYKARISFDKPDKVREIVAQLAGAEFGSKDKRAAASQSATSSAAATASAAASGSPIDSVLQRVTIIGEIIAFRNLLYHSLHDVLESRLPFLLGSLHSLYDRLVAQLKRFQDTSRYRDEDRQAVEHIQAQIESISEMCAAAGIKTNVDVALANAVQAQVQTQRLNDAEEHYNRSCLLLVFIAIALPKLALSRQSFYKACELPAAPNNCHTIALAIDTIASALFSLHGRGDIEARMREFLALAASGLVQIVGSPDAEQLQQHQSIYILLEHIVRCSEHLNYSILESCFPYALIRSSYVNCYRAE